jgi:IclR family acetate operon transcriptional repressor
MRVVKSVVERSFEVLTLLADDARSLSLGQIAAELGTPKSATHRMLTTLCELGWAEQDSQTGFYRLTLRLAVLGQHLLMGTRIPDVCQPVLDKLARETACLVRMAIVDEEGLTWIAQAQGGRTGLVYQPEVVARVPLHCTANGKAWLATLPPATAQQLIRKSRRADRKLRGRNRTKDDAGFAAELEEARARGWAITLEEAEDGVAAIAAPIFVRDDAAKAVGTVSVAGAVHHFPAARIPVLADQVREVANELGQLWPLRRTEASGPDGSERSVVSAEGQKAIKP